MIDPTPETSAATDGITRLCGAGASPIVLLATLGVTFAMTTAVALVVTTSLDAARPYHGTVARVGLVANLGLAALVVAMASRFGGACVPIGAMAASMPVLLAIASFAASFVQARRKKSGPEANSG